MNGVKIWEPYEVRCEFNGQVNKDMLAVVKVNYDLRRIMFSITTFEEFAKIDDAKAFMFGFDIAKINEMNNLPINEKIEFYLELMKNPSLYLSMNTGLRLTNMYYENGTNVIAKRPITWEQYLAIPEEDFNSKDGAYLLEKYFGYKA